MISTIFPFSLPSSAEEWQNLALAFTVIAFTVAFAISATSAALTWKVNKAKKVESERKDVLIATANEQAAKANERAAEANAEVAKANEGLAKSNEEIARLTAETEQAKLERAAANEQIEIAKADAARAKQGIANAEAQSAQASVEVARLRVVVANAEQKRAEAERALLELQERVKDRHLTTSQKQLLVDLLKSPPGSFVHMQCSVGDHEAYDFAKEIAEAIAEAREAGWNPRCCDRLEFKPPVIGLEIRVLSLESLPVHVGTLQEVFRQVGLAIKLVQNAEVPKDEWLLVVGTKP